jgi:hypothetical protein
MNQNQFSSNDHLKRITQDSNDFIIQHKTKSKVIQSKTGVRILCFTVTIKSGQTITRLFHIQLKSIMNHIVCDTI